MIRLSILFSAHKFTSINWLIFYSFRTILQCKSWHETLVEENKTVLTELFRFTDFFEGIYILSH